MHINHYTFGKLNIDDQIVRSDVILYKSTIYSKWHRQHGHLLSFTDIAAQLTAYQPELLIIGTGYFGLMRVPQALQQQLQDSGIELIIAKSKIACKHYNNNQHRKVMAAMHLNC